MTSTVLILGARGRFGLAAARAFADAGWQVLGLVRTGVPVPFEAAGDPRMRWLAADVRDTSAVVRAARGACVVVHALSPVYTNQAWRTQAMPMTDAAIAIARGLNATLMFMGNIYNFGADMPPVLSEDTPQRAQTIKGAIRIAMEQHIQRSGVRAVVIRAGDFFGSGTGTWFDQAMVKDIRKGRFVDPGRPDVARAWAYLPDLARTFVALAAHRDALQPFDVFHFAGHSVSGQRWLETLEPIALARGWVRPGTGLTYRALPWRLIGVGALFVPAWAALLEMRYIWNTPHALDNRKLVALLGTEPHTPLAAAARQALDDLYPSK